VVASLFLNPTQFDDPSDLERYPTNRERDLQIFERHGVDVVFAPTPGDMYPPDAETTVDPGPIAAVLEGAHRPGHFLGVATVVAKILTLLRPDLAVWGAKDAQQNVVIRRISRDLCMGVEHVIVPTVRAPDGLALSSRNRHLSPEERGQAASLYAGLSAARSAWKSGERDAATLLGRVRRAVEAEPLARLEYVSLADPDTLEELPEARTGALLSLAAHVGGTRLIDNVTLG
jgi:pantoate--beta-alanine ligase